MSLFFGPSSSSKTVTPTTVTTTNAQTAGTGGGVVFGSTNLSTTGKGASIIQGNQNNSTIKFKGGKNAILNYTPVYNQTDPDAQRNVQVALAANQSVFSQVIAAFTTSQQSVAQLAQGVQQGQYVGAGAPVTASGGPLAGFTPAGGGNAASGGLTNDEWLAIGLAAVGIAAAIYFSRQ